MKVTVLEVDQFTSTGQIFDMNKIAVSAIRSRVGRFNRIYHVAILSDVDESDGPSIGNVWYRSDESGKMILWKSNYDSSG
ncbi:MAG: hypothetical protein HY226_03980 [Candidatus Vogelbacteria bacterium]|nr:hypothetical protein [Candidatus Vogelbacteria bacterium]